MVLASETVVNLGPMGLGQIGRMLGQGGQGHVYEVHQRSGLRLALKWYRPECATPAQFREIQTLIDFGPPHSRFLWPLSMARIEHEAEFGYVMPLRDSRYLELSYLLAGKDRDGETLEVSFMSVIAMSRQLSYCFLRLHAHGLCYRDISFGNVFFQPGTGDVLVCDNDNVGVDNGSGRVLGTPFFMAPEVVRDLTYQTLPNTDTDRHSLAVLLFYILCVGHPLEGRRTDEGLRDATWLLDNFGLDPLFCMHPENAANRPSKLVQRYWCIYPQFLRDLFIQAFLPGLSDPSYRVTEGQWIKAMDRLRDGMVQCGTCGATNFWDHAEPARPCPTCENVCIPDFVLTVGRRRIAVSPFATLRSDHQKPGVDESSIIGQILRHPRDVRRWGLRNISAHRWTASDAGGKRSVVEPDSTIELAAGLTLRLDSAVVTVGLP